MKWEDIYHNHGIVQSDPLPCVKQVSSLLSNRVSPIVLDAGCGTGRHSFYILKHVVNSEIFAFDVSSKAIDIVRSVAKSAHISSRAKFFIHDIDKDFPFNTKFDAIISTLVIHHGYFKDVLNRFERMVSHLKKGGLIAFACPSIHDPRYKTGITASDGTKLNTDQKDGDIPHYFFSSTDIQKLFQKYFSIFHFAEYSRPMVTAVGTAVNWEIIVQKK